VTVALASMDGEEISMVLPTLFEPLVEGACATAVPGLSRLLPTLQMEAHELRW
jgi:hypothetical protein